MDTQKINYDNFYDVIIVGGGPAGLTKGLKSMENLGVGLLSESDLLRLEKLAPMANT